MKTSSSLNILLAAVLGITAVSAVNAAPVSYKAPSTIAYDQGGNDPFPPSADAIAETQLVIANHEGGSDPFPPSTDAIPETRLVIAHHAGGSDPFPPSSDALPEALKVIA